MILVSYISFLIYLFIEKLYIISITLEADNIPIIKVIKEINIDIIVFESKYKQEPYLQAIGS